MIDISIILCTYNNADSLALTLTELAKCELPENAQIELLIIDNNSPDHTKQVVDNVRDTFNFPCSYYFEKRQGLSYARNTGVEKSSGKYLLFTDDDAVIAPNWLSNYWRAIQHYNFGADCLYGRISIQWDRPKPEWYIDKYRSYFASVDYGDSEMQVKDIHHEFFGKNFCVHRTVVEELGGFDPKLGRCGDKLVAGEETVIYRNLIASGKTVIYLPNVDVGHRLKEREYTYENLSKAFRDSAYTVYNLSKSAGGKLFLGRPLYPIKVALQSAHHSASAAVKSCFSSNKTQHIYAKLHAQRAVSILTVWLKNPGG